MRKLPHRQGRQRIIRFPFLGEKWSPQKLKLHGFVQPWQGFHPIIATQKSVANGFYCRQTQKARKMYQRAPGITGAYFPLQCKGRTRKHLSQYGREGAQKTVFIKPVRLPGIAILRRQIQREREGSLDKAKIWIAIPISPVEALDIGSEQFGINGCQALPSRDFR
jgi:hypothetical protein